MNNSRPLSVLHVSPNASSVGGLRSIMDGLCNAQQDLGLMTCTASVNSGRPHDPRTITFPVLGPRRFALSPAAVRWSASPGASAFDVVHQHGIWNGFSLLTLQIRRRYGAPTIVAPQGSLDRIAMAISRTRKMVAYLAFEMDNLHEASCIQVTCEEEAERVRRLGLRGPIAIIPNAIPVDWIARDGNRWRFNERFGIKPSERQMLFLSRVHPKKGLELFLRSLASIREYLQDWRLVIAGPSHSAEYEGRLTHLVRMLELESITTFTGVLRDPWRRDAFAAAELFVLPTRADNFGIAVAEALGAGVPVITTSGAPIWKLLSDYRCGWFVDRKLTDLGDALLDATHRSPRALRAMGERGRTLVAERFLWPHVAGMTLDLYRWLCGQDARPSFVLPEEQPVFPTGLPSRSDDRRGRDGLDISDFLQRGFADR